MSLVAILLVESSLPLHLDKIRTEKIFITTFEQAMIQEKFTVGLVSDSFGF